MSNNVGEVWFLSVEGVLMERTPGASISESVASQLLATMAKGDAVILNSSRDDAWLRRKIVDRMWQLAKRHDTEVESGPSWLKAMTQRLALVSENGAGITVVRRRGDQMGIAHDWEGALRASAGVKAAFYGALEEPSPKGAAFCHYFTEAHRQDFVLRCEVKAGVASDTAELLMKAFLKTVERRLGALDRAEAAGYRLSSTSNSLEIQRAGLTRAHGLTRGAKWLADAALRPSSVRVVGAGPGDAAAVAALADLGFLAVRFLNVGDAKTCRVIDRLVDGAFVVQHGAASGRSGVEATLEALDTSVTAGSRGQSPSALALR